MSIDQEGGRMVSCAMCSKQIEKDHAQSIQKGYQTCFYCHRCWKKIVYVLTGN